MAELPILFNTKMVKAILDGRKTQTRRIINATGFENMQFDGMNGRFAMFKLGECNVSIPTLRSKYAIGDALYVRESWFYEEHMHDLTDGDPDLPSGRYKHRYVYRASNPDYPVNVGVGATGWRPSIHMPKEAARIWLKITNISIRKLNDMTCDDIIHEGAIGYGDFKKIWDSTVPKDRHDELCWDANPYVWVIEFERIENHA